MTALAASLALLWLVGACVFWRGLKNAPLIEDDDDL